MANPFKPDGYSTVSPYLIATDAAAGLAFLTSVLGGEELRRFEDESGRIVHAEIRVGDSVIMIADEVPPAWSAVRAHVHVYVPDVDDTYRRALAFGAEGVQEPVQKDDEDKRGGVRDSSGTTWWISTRMG